MQQVDVAIDPFKPVEEQVNAIIKALQKVLPLKVAVSVLEIRPQPNMHIRLEIHCRGWVGWLRRGLRVMGHW